MGNTRTTLPWLILGAGLGAVLIWLHSQESGMLAALQAESDADSSAMPVLSSAEGHGLGSTDQAVRSPADEAFSRSVEGQVLNSIEGAVVPRQPSRQDGDAMVQQAVERLARLPVLSANIRQRVDLFDQQLTGSGTYAQLAAEGPVLLTRLELKLQTLEGAATWQQVCDGTKLWMYQKVTSSAVSSVDVATVLAAMRQSPSAGGSTAMGLGIGGLAEMLSSLSLSMRFRDVYASTSGEMKVWVVRGDWKSAAMAQGFGTSGKTTSGNSTPEKSAKEDEGGAVDPKNLRPHVPTHVWVVLGQKDLFPYRIDYCRADRGDERPLVSLEFFDVRQKVQLDEKLFVYRPSRRTVTDGTAEYLRKRGLAMPATVQEAVTP